MAIDQALADLLQSPSKDAIKAVLLTHLARAEFPITDWNSGAVFRTMVEIEAEVLEDLISQAIPFTVGSGYLTSSAKDWLTMLAHGWYERDRVPAASAVQVVTLACAASAGPYTITAGRIDMQATDGARYVATTGGTLASGGTLEIQATAESPRAARGLVNALLTPLMGVTVSAARIIPGGSFGADEETDKALIARCESRFPDLESTPAEDRLFKWAKAASTEVLRIRLDPDPTNAGGILLTVATATGAVSGGALTAVQAYVDDRAPITDYITAQNATVRTINAAGTVTVAATQVASAQAAADAAWLTYLANVKIGTPVYLSELIQAVMDAPGIIDFTGAILNGSAANVTLTSTQVPSAGASLVTQLIWQGV